MAAFVRFFDRKKRGKISWADFKDGFGVAQAASNNNGGSGVATAEGSAGMKALVSGKGSLDTKRLFELAAGLDDGSTGSTTADSSRLLGSGTEPAASTEGEGKEADEEAAATSAEGSEEEECGGVDGGAADVKLSVEGTISVELEGGAKLEVDAAQYLDGLKVELYTVRGLFYSTLS